LRSPVGFDSLQRSSTACVESPFRFIPPSFDVLCFPHQSFRLHCIPPEPGDRDASSRLFPTLSFFFPPPLCFFFSRLSVSFVPPCRGRFTFPFPADWCFISPILLRYWELEAASAWRACSPNILPSRPLLWKASSPFLSGQSCFLPVPHWMRLAPAIFVCCAFCPLHALFLRLSDPSPKGHSGCSPPHRWESLFPFFPVETLGRTGTTGQRSSIAAVEFLLLLTLFVFEGSFFFFYFIPGPVFCTPYYYSPGTSSGHSLLTHRPHSSDRRFSFFFPVIFLLYDCSHHSSFTAHFGMFPCFPSNVFSFVSANLHPCYARICVRMVA